MATITCIEDLRRLYRARVPRMFYDYCESGSYTEQTFTDNSAAFADLRFRQRVAVNIEGRRTASTLLGEAHALPLALAPVGLTGMQHGDGEIHAARAAAAFGVPFTLSTMSIASIEDVAALSPAPFWFQLYVMRDRDFTRRLIERAKAAACSALVVTLDLQILGQRHKDLKNGMTAPPRLTLPNLLDMATKPRWCWSMARTKRRGFGNILGHAKGVTDLSSLMSWTKEQFDPALDWDAVAALRKAWDGKFIVKGILDEGDALRAAKIGADAIVISNHGGRQLDGALPTIRRLPGILRALGPKAGPGKMEVWLDSGIRTGQDIVKTLALGAQGVMIGRSYIYGLGAGGQAGVTEALSLLQSEMDVTMALLGARSPAELGPHNLWVPRDFEGPYTA